jgi:predicted AAA+ superfamily ATPase
VNENHSSSELLYKPRWIVPLLRESVEDHPVVVLTGARQVGKSTLLREEKPFSQWRYVSLDDFDALHQAERDPTALWAGADRVVLDEVQKSPTLLSAVKRAVDQRKRKIRFILSGSANLLLMQKVSESLAGRAVHFTLFPMTRGEFHEQPAPALLNRLFKGKFPAEERIEESEEGLTDLMIRGFMPPLLSLSRPDAVLRWWDGYIATYLERDLRQISSVESLSDFRRVMETLALRSGQMLNQTEVSRDTGVSQPTVHRYLNLLEASCLLVRLPAFAKNRTKRLIKTPKVYWVDPGLASFLAGHHEAESLESSREAGAIFETMVLLHLLVLSHLMMPRPRTAYWRTTTGKEVDFVLEQGRTLMAIEVKRTSSPRYTDTEGLQCFLAEYPETAAGVLVHAGTEILRLHEKIIALPWRAFG